MKTLTKSLFTTAAAAIILGSATMASFAAVPDRPLVKESTSAVTFNKIIVSGNVKVVLVQKSKEAISVGERFDPARTSIKRKGYNLLIHSSEIEPVTVTVAVKDLQRIDVSGISSVVTKGDFKLDYLQLFISYSASADINAKTGSLYTVISDAAELKLSGSADEHTFIAGLHTKANMDNFVCKGTERLTAESIAAISMNRAIIGKSR